MAHWQRPTDKQADYAKALGVPDGIADTRGELSDRIDESIYAKFTGPMRLEKELALLEGIVRGIAIDGIIKPGEYDALQAWCRSHKKVARCNPFNQLIPKIAESIHDGVLDNDERDDILWLCDQAGVDGKYFTSVTRDMQTLHGILGGIAADKLVEEKELRKLRVWMNDHEELQGCWPFDEMDSLIMSVLRDGVVDAQEHAFLVAFCGEFLSKSPQLLLETPDEQLFRQGVCAACPEIHFKGKRFCFTGISTQGTRDEIYALIAKLGGEPCDSVTRKLNYLIIGGEGNASWVFSCYGRKVEYAVNLRREGVKLAIVHEFDFWDAVADCKPTTA